MVVHDEAVVYRTQVVVRIALLHDAEEAVPITQSLARGEIPLIRHRPPDVAIRGEPRHDIAQVTVIGRRVHPDKTPTVVGVEQDDVCLDPQSLQVENTAFQVSKELRLETARVERPAGG